VVVGEKDTVILKTISPPKAEFNKLVRDARKQVRRAGLKRSDVRAVIAKVRKQK